MFIYTVDERLYLSPDMCLKAIEETMVALDPWAHVEPSRFTTKPVYSAGYGSYFTGEYHPGVLMYTLWAHPTVNGGSHEVTEYATGECWEMWFHASGEPVDVPRRIFRVPLD